MKHLAVLLLCLLPVILASCSDSLPPALSGNEAPLLAFREPPGVYSKAFRVTVECTDPSLEVRYTLDSRIPTPKDELYPEDGIELSFGSGDRADPSSVHIIRAAAFDSDGNPVGQALTGTYILSDSPDVRYSTMIVSVVCEPDDLYGYERGIMVKGKKYDDFKIKKPDYWTNESRDDANYFGSGIEWERAANVEFFAGDGTPMLSQMMGVRVSGGWNRSNEHKSLRLFARYTYADANVMRVDAYPGLVSTTGVPVTAHKTLILRTGSNNMGSTTIQTPFLMELGEDVGLNIMHYRPVCVYLNGKYYGYMALMEDYSTTYFEQNYNIPAEEITCINGTGIISGGEGWILDNGPESELAEFMRVRDYIINTDMTITANYQRACKWLDIDNFVRYMCFEGYLSNTDWPQNNVRVWRRFTDGYQPDAGVYGYDGRWRFLLKDLDLSSGYGSDGAATSIFKRLDSDDGTIRLNAVFKSLFKNKDFRNRVFCFISDMLSTTMKLENVMEAIGETALSAQPEMRYYIPSYNVCGGSLENWHNHLRTPYKFFRQRWTNVYNELPGKYGSDWGELEVQIEGEGELHISTLSLTQSTALHYLVGLEIPVSAIPERGWRLASLELSKGRIGDGSFVMSEKSLTLKIQFEPDPDFEPPVGLRLNEVKYEYPMGSAECDYVEIFNSSDTDVYLKGFSLEKDGLRADGTPDSDRWVFPAIRIAPGEYLTVCFDKYAPADDSGKLLAAHGLGAGDTLSLLDRNGDPVDSVILPVCSNETVLARGDEGWYFAPHTSFGGANPRSDGYSQADVLDESAHGTFMHNGHLIPDFASESPDGTLVITEAMLRKQFSSYTVDNKASALEDCRIQNGYDLDKALAVLGYERFDIPSLGSHIIMKK